MSKENNHKILCVLFPRLTRQMEVCKVSGPDFKIVEYSGMNGYRRRSSIWFVDYSHLEMPDKENVAGLANEYNSICRKIESLRREQTEIKKAIKSICENPTTNE